MRVIITVFHPFISRNILYGPIISKLQDAGVELIALVPENKESHFRKLLEPHSVQIVPVDTKVLISKPRNVLIQRISFLLIRSHYLWYKQVERRNGAGILGWIKYSLERIFVLFFAHSYIRKLFRFFFRHYADLGWLQELMKELSPALVVSTDVFAPADYLVLQSAKLQGIKTLAMVRSWDNCYSKGLLPILPERMLTNTYFLKEEVHNLHGMPLERIEVVGLPQMDSLFNAPPFDRSTFMQKLGADPADKLIVFAPGGSVLTDIDGQLCDILQRAVDNKAIKYKVHVLVRNHPHHPADLSKFSNHPHFTVEYPGHPISGNTKNAELLPQEQDRLRDTLQAADVVLWIATTLGIDVAVFDKPQIMLNFDGYEQKPYLQSVRKYYDEDHMKKMVATGGAHVVRSKEEMIKWINNYLENPALDAEKRKKIIDTQLVYTDGKSGERFARAVLNALE